VPDSQDVEANQQSHALVSKSNQIQSSLTLSSQVEYEEETPSSPVSPVSSTTEVVSNESPPVSDKKRRKPECPEQGEMKVAASMFLLYYCYNLLPHL
jgi:hypothetical protein